MKKRILVVDDTQAIRELMRDLLIKHGYEVFTAENGREAIIFFQAGGVVDAVVTDRRMPEMGGEELTRWIKNQRPEIKVMVASSDELGVFAQSARDAGADTVISKNKLALNLPLLLAQVIGRP